MRKRRARLLPVTEILVTGANGQLGSLVVNRASARGLDVRGVGSGDLDITESLTIGTFVVPDDELPVIDASALGNRIFDVRPGTELFALQRVILSGGEATAGAGIYIRDGVDEVTLNRVLLYRNDSTVEVVTRIYELNRMTRQLRRTRDSLRNKEDL